MRRILVLTYSLIATLVFAGCEQATDPNVQSKVLAPQASLVASPKIRLKAPANIAIVDGNTRVNAPTINPGDYVCTDNSPISNWWLSAVLDFRAAEPALFNLLYRDLLTDVVVTYEALLFETTATPQYFGYKGAFTRDVLNAERDVKGFWDIKSSDIQVVAMHGTVLQNVEKVAATYEAVFTNDDGTPLSHADAIAIAQLVRDAVLSSTKLNGGNHPLFTFNAFAISAPGFIPDKIVMGDAILEGYAALGFSDVAPRAVFAHEFGHHIQYENGYFGDPFATTADEPANTRYTELMADAFAGYYLTHARGAALNRKRVEQFLEVFFQIGDCAFSNDGHHGTPNQRMKAARFGFDVAAAAMKQGQILTSKAFHDLFVAVYPSLVAPDAH